MSPRPPQRRLILYMSMSLDGFAARADGTMDWMGRSQTYGAQRQRAVSELLGQIGTIVLGRRAAEDMARAWPGTDSPTGRFMNELPKVVFSRTISELEWDQARVCDRPVEEEILRLKAQEGRDLVCFGGASFARALAGHDLIDEYRVTVQPVVLGDGLALLHEAPHLELVSTTTYADGPVIHTYERAGES